MDRVTTTVRSDSGREYLYDDVTGNVFPWSPGREAALESVFRQNGNGGDAAAPATTADVAFIRFWRERYGAFCRETAPVLARPTPEGLRERVASHSMQLILVVSEQCNPRCRYCAYSGVYVNHRTHSERRMSLSTAKSAVDWYADLVAPQVRHSPRKRFGLTFYGGEPLVSWDVIAGLLEYLRSRYRDLFVPAMTTNGTLLTPEKVKVLAEHQVHMVVSIDGPAAEHDRQRVDTGGHGTYGRIIENVVAVKKAYPQYWAEHLTAVCVYDWETDLEAVSTFFDEHTDLVPRAVFVMPVGARQTEYWAAARPDGLQRFNDRLDRLRARYKQAKIRGEPTGTYLTSLVGAPVMRWVIRPRIGDKRDPLIPYSGTCVPGDKIAVQVDGRLDLCERVNGTYPIGHLNQGGLDFERMCALIAEYQDTVLEGCGRCPMTRFCGVCYSNVEGRGGPEPPGSRCAETAAFGQQSLIDYVSIMEANPKAEFLFETDLSYLDTRMLLFC